MTRQERGDQPIREEHFEMGSLIGHVVPGTFFGIYAIYMIVRIFWEYYHAVLTSR